VRARLAALAALLFFAGNAAAQVGYPPSQSPYLDLPFKQEISAIFGYYVGRDDPAGVVPGNGSVVGLHYEWRAGGPAHLVAEVTHISSSRTILDPTKPPSTRNLGTQSWPLWNADFGLGMSLTGGRSWHHFVPEANAGVGLVSDFKKADVGDFKYGTRFALTWGAALRYVPGGHYQIRADISNRLNSISYPDAYFRTPTGGGAPILTGIDKSIWRNNPSFTIGLSYLFSR
jgi:hypothetical protein